MWLAVFVVGGIGLLWSLGRGPNAIWGTATLGLIVGLIWGFLIGEGFALVLRGAAVGAVAGVCTDLLATIPKMLGAVRDAREMRANLIELGADPNNLPAPGSHEYKALIAQHYGRAPEEMDNERKAS
jgi:hypothetical protein